MRIIKGGLVVLLFCSSAVFVSMGLVRGDDAGTSSANVGERNVNKVTNKQQSIHDPDKNMKSDKGDKERDKHNNDYSDKGKDKGKDKDRDRDKDKDKNKDRDKDKDKDKCKDDKKGVKLPPDPGEKGRKTLLGIDMDGDGVRDDIQRYIYFTYPDDKKLRLGLTYYAIEFQGVLKDADDREACYDHAIKMDRHVECLFYLKGEEAVDICNALRAKILNTRERSIVYIRYSDNLGGRIIMGSPQKEWKDSCSFDIDETGGDQ